MDDIEQSDRIYDKQQAEAVKRDAWVENYVKDCFPCKASRTEVVENNAEVFADLILNDEACVEHLKYCLEEQGKVVYDRGDV